MNTEKISQFFQLTLLLLFSVSTLAAQNVIQAELVKSLMPVRNDSNQIIKKIPIYSINCRFQTNLPADSLVNPEDWFVLMNDKKIAPDQIRLSGNRSSRVKLIGPFDTSAGMFVSYQNNPPVPVEIDPKQIQATRWGFGRGKAITFSGRRIANQKSLLALDYNMDVNILENYFPAQSGRIWFRSLAFNIASQGTIASNDLVRNGTQSTLGLQLQPFFFTGGLVYYAQFFLNYVLETRENQNNGKLLEVINKSFNTGLTLEIPYTNYPIYKLHQKTGYIRLAMPLTLTASYFGKGKDLNGSGTLARLDLNLRYELAFSPWLILKGEWQRSNFFTSPAGWKNSETYYSVTIAQDLDILKENFGILGPVLGNVKKARGKHFIFYRISAGRKAPAFQDIREQSFGFGMFL